jgi:hypothetical protein
MSRSTVWRPNFTVNRRVSMSGTDCGLGLVSLSLMVTVAGGLRAVPSVELESRLEAALSADRRLKAVLQPAYNKWTPCGQIM